MTAPSASGISQEEIDDLLRVGSNTDDARMKLATEFSKGKTQEELTAFVRQTYHGGYGIQAGYYSVSAWYAEDGIHLAQGRSAEHNSAALVLSWEDAAARIGELLEQGQFATNVELAEAPGFERRQLADAILYAIRDVSEEGREQGWGALYDSVSIRGSGFPEMSEYIAEVLENPEMRKPFAERFRQFVEAWQENPTILRFRIYRPVELLRRLDELELPRREYYSDMAEPPAVRHFITEDEIDHVFSDAHDRLRIREVETVDLSETEEGSAEESIPADPAVRNFSYTVVDGKVYYRQNSVMVKPDLPASTVERVKGMVELRDCVHHLIALQMDGSDALEIYKEQQRLNKLYDAYTAKYGLINSRGNSLAFSADSAYYLLCSLEVLDEDGNLERKGDFFTKRTIKQHTAVTSVDTSSEALAVSIAEKARVDMDYMMRLTGKTEEEIFADLKGVIFLNPMHGYASDKESKYLPADEYLSGNIREKLEWARRSAELSPDDYAPNVEALTQALPKELDASEIDVRLGATWVDKKYIQQFMYETFKTPNNLRSHIRVNFSTYTAEWSISGKTKPSAWDVMAYTTYGTDRANAYRILEDTLNLRDVRIYDTIKELDGKERRVLNQKETTLAQQKQQAVKDAFRDWVWKDPQRRHELVQRYNEQFNSTRPREYDGRHITFGGINPEIALREHQLNAIAHVLYGGNTLLAHEVGAGKTFEMVAAAMESKRLGLCQKSLFAVPNHLVEQWSAEFLRLYPSANILVATKKDFEKANRKKFCARIATGDYDAIIMGHSQFERLPVSYERREHLLKDQIAEIEAGIEELEESGAEKFSVKQLERTKRSLEARLEKLHSAPKDDVVTFEQLGVDRLFIDEAHAFKNLFLYTKMRNVAGLSTSDAQKSSDMLLKCRYIDEITGGKGVVFATGTPVSNSMTELYVRP